MDLKHQIELEHKVYNLEIKLARVTDILRNIILHNYAAHCQECGIGQSDSWKQGIGYLTEYNFITPEVS